MGRMPGLRGSRWCVGAWNKRARENQEGSAGLLRAGHAGDGQASRQTAIVDLISPILSSRAQTLSMQASAHPATAGCLRQDFWFCTLEAFVARRPRLGHLSTRTRSDHPSRQHLSRAVPTPDSSENPSNRIHP